MQKRKPHLVIAIGLVVAAIASLYLAAWVFSWTEWTKATWWHVPTSYLVGYGSAGAVFGAIGYVIWYCRNLAEEDA